MASSPLLSTLIRSSALPGQVADLVDQIIAQGVLEERVPVPQPGCSVLTWLIEKRHSGLALKVLDHGADPLHASDAGYQAIHAAAAFNDLTVCQALIKRGASLHAATRDGSTAVHYAFTDELDAPFADWVLDQLRAPGHAFMKKADLGFAARDTVWGLMARYGRREGPMLEVLKLLDERGMIDDLLQSEKPSVREVARSFQHELLNRFGKGVVGGWWSVRGEGRALEKSTPLVSTSPRRPRF